MRTTEMKSNEEWSSQLWTQFMQLRKKPEKINQEFNGIWTSDLAIPVRRFNQLSYEATDSPIVSKPWKQWSAVSLQSAFCTVQQFIH